jgi:uncharacterized protein HemY
MLAVSAWIALAEGDKAQAEKLMRRAADSEDNSVKSVMMERTACIRCASCARSCC